MIASLLPWGKVPELDVCAGAKHPRTSNSGFFRIYVSGYYF